MGQWEISGSSPPLKASEGQGLLQVGWGEETCQRIRVDPQSPEREQIPTSRGASSPAW